MYVRWHFWGPVTKKLVLLEYCLPANIFQDHSTLGIMVFMVASNYMCSIVAASYVGIYCPNLANNPNSLHPKYM